MIVVDANIWVYRFIEGPFTAVAQQVWKKDNEWKTSQLCPYEIVNVLALYQRSGQLTLSQGLELLRYVTLQLEPATQSVEWPLTLTLAAQYRVSGYDAQYLALAQTLAVPLITEDRKLRLAAPPMTLSMQEFLNS